MRRPYPGRARCPDDAPPASRHRRRFMPLPECFRDARREAEDDRRILDEALADDAAKAIEDNR